MILRSWAVALQLLMLAVAARGQPAPCHFDSTSDPYGPAYLRCVIAKAKNFEPSGESADNVALAALGACEPARLAFSHAIGKCGGTKLATAVFANIDPRLRNAAIAAVVDIRARRHLRGHQRN